MPKMSDYILFLYEVEKTLKTMNNGTMKGFADKRTTNKTK